MVEKYLHLDPRIRGAAEEDSAFRIRMIEKDLFIEHDYSRYLNSVLDDFMCGQRQTRIQASIIRRMLTAHQSKIVIFDEIQHICHTRSRDRAVVLDTLKSISTECQISVICAGTPAVQREFHADPQIERRFDITSFVSWTLGSAFKRFLETYERARPLRLASNLTDPEMMREILAETGGVTHRIMQRLNAAAVVAIHEKTERITPELLAVKRLEPERVLQAKRASTIESVVEADRIRTYPSMSKREPRRVAGT